MNKTTFGYYSPSFAAKFGSTVCLDMAAEEVLVTHIKCQWTPTDPRITNPHLGDMVEVGELLGMRRDIRAQRKVK